MLYEADLTDSTRFLPNLEPTLARPVDVTEPLRVGFDLSTAIGKLLTERLNLRDRMIGNGIQQLTVSDTFRLMAELYRAQTVSATDGVVLEQTQSLLAAAQLFERIRVREAVVGNGNYQITVTQSFRLAVSLARFFGVDVVEDLALDDAMLARALAFARVDEDVGIEALLTPQLLLSVRVADGIELDPTQAVRMLYNPLLRDGVSIEAGFLQPNGSFSTWVMNTRSAGVTEYENFDFNSFMPIGNRYIGASEEGLFELSGDTDDGEDIIASVKGGYLQFGGTQLSRLKEAYIAATGEGRMILKVRTKDGEEYVYEVDTRDGRSTRFHMGKGQRSRYFAYELISAGQDFDLDTLEFVPIVVQRRV